jgi:ribosomal protein S19E (S16A)
MNSRLNPKKLNPLQLRTLAIFQKLATMERHVAQVTGDGAVTLWNLPHAHGDHFHVGDAVIRTRDASGLTNPSVWAALERKGLLEGEFPTMATLSREALEYPVGDLGLFTEHSDH